MSGHNLQTGGAVNKKLFKILFHSTIHGVTLANNDGVEKIPTIANFVTFYETIKSISDFNKTWGEMVNEKISHRNSEF